jgi:site-specific recombinase XerD
MNHGEKGTNMGDPHNYTRKLESAVERVKSSSLSTKNKEAILKFKDECLLELSAGRTLRYVQNLVKLAKWLGKDFTDVNKDDIKALVRKINSKGYTEWTKQFYRVTLRKFYRWLRGSEGYPPEVSWLKTTIKSNNRQLPEDMLSQADVKRLILAAQHPRDRAMIAVLYETGCRVGELLALKIRNIEFDSWGARILLNGKTGMRKVRVVSAAPYLTEWINRHPGNGNSEDPLWVDLKGGKAIGYGAVK